MPFTTTQYKRLAAVASVATALTTQYTVPAATQDVVKDIDINNTTGADQTITLTLAGVNLFTGTTVPANGTLHWTGTIVLGAGETISTSASAVGLALLVNGLENT